MAVTEHCIQKERKRAQESQRMAVAEHCNQKE